MAIKNGKLEAKVLHCRQVLAFAISTRVFMVALMLLWRVLGHPYDTSALLNPPCLLSSSSDHTVPLLPKLGEFFEKFIVWDGVYYIRIAECGYEYEHTFAFLPVFPLCIRLVSVTVLSGLMPLIGYRATLSLSGFLVNIIAFSLSSVFFYKVSYIILKHEKLAYLSTALFCVNPASIFYASIYSESLFSLLTFAGLLEFFRGSRWRASCLFGISGSVRSNGVVHGGFLLFYAMQEFFKAFRQRDLKMAVRTICSAVMQTAIVFGPFVAFQAFGFMKLCWKETRGIEDIYARPWCNKKLPYLYGFVQSHYWDVGFLRYFQVKQLPNFLLASPMLSLAVGSVVYYVRHRPKAFLTLGLCLDSVVPVNTMNKDIYSRFENGTSAWTKVRDSNVKQRARNRIEMNAEDDKLIFQSADEDDSSETEHISDQGGFFSPLCVPFLVEMAFMALVACFIMYVQVATRFLSICAPVYWFAAHLIHSRSNGKMWAYLIWGVFLFYGLLGSLLFVNFYPFT